MDRNDKESTQCGIFCLQLYQIAVVSLRVSFLCTLDLAPMRVHLKGHFLILAKCLYIKVKGKVRPRTGHEAPEGE